MRTDARAGRRVTAEGKSGRRSHRPDARPPPELQKGPPDTAPAWGLGRRHGSVVVSPPIRVVCHGAPGHRVRPPPRCLTTSCAASHRFWHGMLSLSLKSKHLIIFSCDDL